MELCARVNEMWLDGDSMEDFFEKARGIASVIGRAVKLDVCLGREIYIVRPDGSVERDRSLEFAFKVGGTYYHAFYPSEKRVKFVCTRREGNNVTLEEVGGKKRVFSGEVGRANVYGGFNETLKIGVIRFPDYTMVDSIVAHDFLHEGEVA